jgi:hypothetical protein
MDTDRLPSLHVEGGQRELLLREGARAAPSGPAQIDVFGAPRSSSWQPVPLGGIGGNIWMAKFLHMQHQYCALAEDVGIAELGKRIREASEAGAGEDAAGHAPSVRRSDKAPRRECSNSPGGGCAHNENVSPGGSQHSSSLHEPQSICLSVKSTKTSRSSLSPLHSVNSTLHSLHSVTKATITEEPTERDQ